MSNNASCLVIVCFSGMLSHEEEDSDTDTGISSVFASSTEINVYVNPHEKHNDMSRREKEKESSKYAAAQVKRSLFKDLRNKNLSC